MAAPAAIEAELTNFVEALAPSVKLTSKEAGAYLRVSQSPLEHWRVDGLRKGCRLRHVPDNGQKN